MFMPSCAIRPDLIHYCASSGDARGASHITDCCRCAGESISVDNLKKGLAQVFRYHSLTLSRSLDDWFEKNGRKGPMMEVDSGRSSEGDHAAEDDAIHGHRHSTHAVHHLIDLG